MLDNKMKRLDGSEQSLEDYQGKVLMLVNVASYCGNTPQYTALEALYKKYSDKGLILILKEHHEKLDRLVFEAYGWPDTLTEEQILEKLVALNHERAAEERRGHVRWLQPDYQIPRFGKRLDKQAAKEEGAQIAAELGLAHANGPL